MWGTTSNAPFFTVTVLRLCEPKHHPAICIISNISCSLSFTLAMFKAVLLDKDCWITNMRLDPKTGLDPEGVRLRAAQGLEAADYFVQG